jgi:hypothetical protein
MSSVLGLLETLTVSVELVASEADLTVSVKEYRTSAVDFGVVAGMKEAVADPAPVRVTVGPATWVQL